MVIPLPDGKISLLIENEIIAVRTIDVRCMPKEDFL
jgi:hypothetical protein